MEAAQSRHWGGPEEAGSSPSRFLAHPKGLQSPPYFENPLRQGPGDRAPGLFSIREDAQEVQRNASNYSTTSRDCLLPSGLAQAGDGSQKYGGVLSPLVWSAGARQWLLGSLLVRCISISQSCVASDMRLSKYGALHQALSASHALPTPVQRAAAMARTGLCMRIHTWASKNRSRGA